MQSDPPQAPQSAVPIPEIPVDPNLALEQQQAQTALIAGLQQQASGDTASLMAKYGTRLALRATGTAV